jgi:hypothetical protein
MNKAASEAAERHRHQAEEFRAKADMMRDESTRDAYSKMADAYDAMAANEEKIGCKSPHPHGPPESS